jgi:hypothetical protein
MRLDQQIHPADGPPSSRNNNRNGKGNSDDNSNVKPSSEREGQGPQGQQQHRHHHHHHHHHAHNKGKEHTATDKAMENRIATEEEQERHKTPLIEIIRIHLKKFMSRSLIGRVYTQIMIVLSLVSCLEYIYQTYLTDHLKYERDQRYVLALFELIISSLFTFDWVVAFFLADHKLVFICSFYSMVDLLTVIPIYVFAYNDRLPTQYEVNTFNEFIFYAIRTLNTTRVLRVLRVRRHFANIEDPVNRCLGEIALKCGIMILFGMSASFYLFLFDIV